MNKNELLKRIDGFYKLMNRQVKDWEIVVLTSGVNQYYFTGTMQNAVLVFLRNGDMHLFVRKSIKRAEKECPLDIISPMGSYRDMIPKIGSQFKCGYFELETIPYNMLARINKHLGCEKILPIDKIIAYQRSIKSQYEIAQMEEAGKLHHDFMVNTLPTLIYEGISETTLTARCFEELIKAGHHGIARFSEYNNINQIGQISFGENSYYPVSSDTPSGMKGIQPSVPILGSRERLLKKGDLVYVDLGFGINGYHTDRTQLYMFKKSISPDIKEIQNRLIDIEKDIAAMLKSGAIPSKIYHDILAVQSDEFLENFMGIGGDKVKFIGHGIGLNIDEMPVLARGFDAPLEKNMVLAIEPKYTLKGIGTLGVEDTYVVTKDGGRCITGGYVDIIQI